jgi:hypothetical protein
MLIIIGGKMKKNNIYILLIMQALLSILLLFIESTPMYIALGLFLLIDLVVFASLLMKKWAAKELYIFITLFVSIIYLLFLFYVNGELLMVIAIGQMLLFLISAILSYERSVPKSLPIPIKPAGYVSPFESVKPTQDAHKLETYDLSEMEHDLDEIDKSQRVKRKEDEKFRARTFAYELEREAAELKRAERFVRRKDGEATQVEIVKEALAMETAAKHANVVEIALKEAELKRQTKELQNAEKNMRDVEILNKEKELSKQTKQLREAEQKIKEIEFLNKQQELNRQAIELAKAQAEVNKAASKKKTPAKTKKSVKTKTSTTKTAKKESPVFATYNGNSFHETGCMIIKKTPKKNLILFNNQKDALKKGYKPGNVCKP